jgi:hypothetical protein
LDEFVEGAHHDHKCLLFMDNVTYTNINSIRPKNMDTLEEWATKRNMTGRLEKTVQAPLNKENEENYPYRNNNFSSPIKANQTSPPQFTSRITGSLVLQCLFHL